MIKRKTSKLINLKGKKIGHLLVLRKLYAKRTNWECKCTADDCGKIIKVPHNRLIDKTTPKTHCGCLRGGLPKRYPREYHAWWDAKSRCHNPDHPSYPSYGAQGITMCDRWREGFEAFLTDVGARPAGHSLDRINAHGAYEPGNVRWATIKTQARNKKGTKWVRHPDSGEPIQAAALAEELGLTYQVMRQRMIDNKTWWVDVEPPAEGYVDPKTKKTKKAKIPSHVKKAT